MKAMIRISAPHSGQRSEMTGTNRMLALILIALGQPIAPPTIAPARGPPLWAAQDDAASDTAASDALPPADTLAPPTPDFVFDQRLAW